MGFLKGALARLLSSTAGPVEIFDERHMLSSTGLGGCGPAIVFKILTSVLLDALTLP